MALFSIYDMIIWGVAAIICEYVAKRKGKRRYLALFMGILFGGIAMLYYLFSKSENPKWKGKDSWYILGGYLLFVIALTLIKALLS